MNLLTILGLVLALGTGAVGHAAPPSAATGASMNCTRGAPEPLIDPANRQVKRTSYVPNGLEAQEGFVLRSGVKGTIHHQGCHAYVLSIDLVFPSKRPVTGLADIAAVLQDLDPSNGLFASAATTLRQIPDTQPAYDVELPWQVQGEIPSYIMVRKSGCACKNKTSVTVLLSVGL